METILAVKTAVMVAKDITVLTPTHFESEIRVCIVLKVLTIRLHLRSVQNKKMNY